MWVDVNREAFELDPAMFQDRLPDYVITRNARIAAGLGTIARVVANAAPVYTTKLEFAEAETRIRHCWSPYHAALSQVLEDTREHHGHAILLDCHSMPSAAAAAALRTERDERGYRQIDVVLGDCHGISCHPDVMATAEVCLKDLGYRVRRNSPYAGGFVTRHYGEPRVGVHALQIELNRSLYG